jgi:hypothetical protein
MEQFTSQRRRETTKGLEEGRLLEIGRKIQLGISTGQMSQKKATGRKTS